MTVLGAAALAVAPAWANPLVGDWTYTFSSHFDTTQTVISGNCSAHPNVNTATEIAWGCPQGSAQSSLEINPATQSGQTVTTNGSASNPGVLLIHHNFVIDTGVTLDTAVLGATLTFTAPNAGGSPWSHDFNINFTETPNTAGTCVAESDAPCADIFVITGGTFSTSFTGTDGNLYTVAFGLTGLTTPLDSDVCSAAGASDGCSGFITQENQNNNLQFFVAVDGTEGQGPGTPVPEPSALGLMGLGLLSLMGLVALRRRRAGSDSAD